MLDDPLDRIWVKPELVEGAQRKLLSDLIFPFAGFDPESGKVYFNPKGDMLSAKHRILIYLLGRLALSIRPNSTFSPRVTPKDIEDALQLRGGTVRPALARLLNEHVISKNGEGYMVPSANLSRAQKLFQDLIAESESDIGAEFDLQPEA